MANDVETIAMPVRVTWLGDLPLVEWRAVGLTEARGPRFYEAAERAAVLRIAPLDEAPDPAGPIAISGTIQHIWRCGSTLLCAQFNAVPGCLALSEPFVFSNLLVGRVQDRELARIRIRKLAGLLAGAVQDFADHLVIKWPGLIGQHAAQLEQALPEVPGIFLHRRPRDVLASMLREPLGEALGLPQSYFGAMPAAADRDSLLGAAYLIAGTCAEVAAATRLRHCNYERLPAATAERIAPWFGITLDPSGHDAMAASAQWHSKHPRGTRAFSGDLPPLVDDRTLIADAEAVIEPALARTLAALQPV